jgi:hypothetical protein
MVDLASAANIVYLAFAQFLQTDAGKKLLEGSFGKLGEKLTEGTLKKMGELRQLIWNRLRGKPGAEPALKAAETGSEADLKQVIALLQAEMEQSPEFARELSQVAEQIINIASVEGRNVQNIYGGQGMQVNDAHAPVIQANTVTLNYGPKPDT